MTTDKQPEGLGDVIENITKATGIKKLVKWMFGDDCGCDARKEKLNKLFPRKKNTQCLNEQEYSYLEEIKLKDFNTATRLSAQMQKDILVIYNRVFNQRKQSSSCNSCVINTINEMKTVLKAYENE